MTRIGIALEGDVAAVIVLEGDEPTWTTMVSLKGCVADSADAIAQALTRSALPRWPHARVNVALGWPHGRVKHVHGVPPVKSSNELRALLEFNRGRFVASRRPVCVLGAQSAAPGEAIIGVADAETMAALRAALSKAPVRLRLVAPLSVVRSPQEHDAGALPRDLLTDATAVAGLSGRCSLALDARRPAAGQASDVPWWRLAAAGVAFLGAVGGAAAAPTIRSMREMRADSAAARVLAARADSAARDARELAGMRRDLRRVADFSNGRASATLLLNAIAAALPEQAVISTIHVDTLAAELVVLSPRTAEVINALGDVPGLSAPLVIGPVSREVVAGHELDRATVRATFTRGEARGRAPFAVDRNVNGEQ